MQGQSQDERKSQISGIINLYFQSRQIDHATSIIEHMKSKSATGAENGLTGNEIAEFFSGTVPRTNTYRILERLETIGLIDRRTKNEGYFLSYVFIKRAERASTFWRSFLKN